MLAHFHWSISTTSLSQPPASGTWEPGRRSEQHRNDTIRDSIQCNASTSQLKGLLWLRLHRPVCLENEGWLPLFSLSWSEVARGQFSLEGRPVTSLQIIGYFGVRPHSSDRVSVKQRSRLTRGGTPKVGIPVLSPIWLVRWNQTKTELSQCLLTQFLLVFIFQARCSTKNKHKSHKHSCQKV